MNTLSTLRSCLRAANSSRTCLPPFTRAFSTTTPRRREDGAKEKQNEAEKTKGNTSNTPPPFATPPKLESTELHPPPDPSLQQRRRRHVSKEALDGVTCVGWDGSAAAAGDWNVDYKEYYEKHKPSPLSEIEMVDTRKPITRAMDGRQEEGIGAALVEDTVDAALERAERMFREAAARGDPEAPHSRALARLLALRRSNTSNDMSIKSS